MRDRMGSELDALGLHLLHLAPVERAGHEVGARQRRQPARADIAHGQEDRGGDLEPGQDGQGMLVVVLEAVIERDDRAPVTECRIGGEPVNRLGQREQRVAVAHQILELALEGPGADARSDGGVADAVVVEDADPACRGAKPAEPVQRESDGSEERAARNKTWLQDGRASGVGEFAGTLSRVDLGDPHETRSIDQATDHVVALRSERRASLEAALRDAQRVCACAAPARSASERVAGVRPRTARY